MTFVVTFMLSSDYVKNPYLRAKLVEVITNCRIHYIKLNYCRFLSSSFQMKSVHLRFWLPYLWYVIGYCFWVSLISIQGHSLAHKHLVPALMHLYVDIEFTGSHTQFYDKFNVRYYISKLMKFLWGMPIYKKSMHEQSEYVTRKLGRIY